MEKIDQGMTIGERVKKFREARGWSQNQLAKELSARPSIDSFYAMTVKRIEDGQRELKLNEAIELASLYEVTLDALLRGDDTGLEESERLLRVAKSIEQFELSKQAVINGVSGMYQSIFVLQQYFAELDSDGDTPRFKNSTVLKAFEIANEERAWGAVEQGAKEGHDKIPFENRDRAFGDYAITPQHETVLGVAPSGWGTAQLPFEDAYYTFKNRS